VGRITDALITHVPCQLRLLVYPLCYDDRFIAVVGVMHRSGVCLSVCHVMTHQEAALVTASASFVPNVAPNILLVETEAQKHIMGMLGNHRRHSCASPVLTAMGYVNWKPWEPVIFNPHRIDIPEPIATKFVTGDYVHDFYSCVKFGGNPSMGGLGANR